MVYMLVHNRNLTNYKWWMCISASYGNQKLFSSAFVSCKESLNENAFGIFWKTSRISVGCLCKHKKLSLFILQQTRIVYKFMLRWIDLIASQNSASFHKNNFLGFSFDIKNMTLHPMSAINFMKMVKQVDHIYRLKTSNLYWFSLNHISKQTCVF